MRHFCLGFPFSPDQDRVLLLQKRVTDRFNPGAWNGLGGTVEEDETAAEAMSRECCEEAGLQIDVGYWKCIGQLTDGESFLVDVFIATAHLSAASQKTDETIRVFDRSTAQDLDYANGVGEILMPWLKGKALV